MHESNPVTKVEPYFIFEEDTPDAATFALQHLQDSIRENPGRVAAIVQGLSEHPSEDELHNEPLIDLVLLATTQDTSPTFDLHSENAIRIDPVMVALHNARNLSGIAAVRARVDGTRLPSGFEIRKTRLALFIARVGNLQQATDADEALPRTDTVFARRGLRLAPLESDSTAGETGNSDSSAA